MHPNEQLIKDFYSHLNQKNHQKMAEAYTENATFKDELFLLKGIEVKAMWRMLCEASSQDFRIECKKVQADDQKGTAEWEAFYTFSRTGKKVHNKLKSTFEFRDGKIHVQEDIFNFWSWSSQAFGIVGLLMGWTSGFRNKIKETINQSLQKFIEKNYQA